MTFETYTLDELVSIKYGKNQKKVLSDTGTVPIYGTGGLMGYATEALYDKPSVLIGRKGTIEKIRYVDHPFWTVDTLFYTIVNESIVVPQFLYYTMLQLDLLQYNEGTTIPSLRTETLNRIELQIPSIDNQKRILRYLATIDNKITLNTAINENLEQQAQAIYRSMFVTLHHDSDRMGLLSELITVKYGKDHKKLNDGVYPVYGSGGIMRYVERPLYDKESVLIPRKGSLNNVMYVNEPFWSVDTMFYTEMKQPNVAKFVFHFVKSKDLASLNAGSAVPSMTTDILNSMELRIPSADRLAEFEGLVAPLYRAIEDNTRQSARLATLRDTLLPKLMNGEIDVSAVKI